LISEKDVIFSYNSQLPNLQCFQCAQKTSKASKNTGKITINHYNRNKSFSFAYEQKGGLQWSLKSAITAT
jgi:hypothetical protein